MTPRREFFQDCISNDVYAVELDYWANVTASCGPLRPDEVYHELLPKFRYRDDQNDYFIRRAIYLRTLTPERAQHYRADINARPNEEGEY